MKPKQVLRGVWHVRLKKPVLGKTFLRFSESLDSPVFGKKTFTVPEFNEWYREKYGKFNYYDYWDGFTIPASALNPFRKGKFNPLSAYEKNLLSAFRKIKNARYIIGTDGRQSTLNHELAHSLFCLSPRYRKEVKKIMRKVNTKAARSLLLSRGYSRAVSLDEIHAHIISGLQWFSANGVNTSKYKLVAPTLRNIFRKHLAEKQAELM